MYGHILHGPYWSLKVDLECVSNIVNKFGPPGFDIRVLLFLFLKQKICFGYPKELYQSNSSNTCLTWKIRK